MESSSQKILRSSEEDVGRDRLSELPDEVIVHILSLMPTVDAVRTVVLRRFGNLWTMVHTLKLYMKGFLSDLYPGGEWDRYNVKRFCRFVSHVLMLHRRPSIDIFHLSLEFEHENESIRASDDIKMWLRSVLDRKAREIAFHNLSMCQYARIPILPDFASESLVTLKLSNCKIEPQFFLNFRCLKKLLLYCISMCDEAFQRFLSGCPSLEEVDIMDPHCMNKLSFNAPNIDKLSLSLTGKKWMNPLLLDCPNLKSLDLEVDGLLPKVIDVSSVRFVNIGYFYYPIKDYDKRTMLQMFLGKLEVDYFKLSFFAAERFLHKIRHLHPLQVSWKRVVLELEEFCQSCVKGLYQLMRSVKLLEELIIYTSKNFEFTADLLHLELPSPRVMPQLKTTTLHGHVKSRKHQLKLVEFLLRNSDVFGKLIIVPIKR